MHAFQLTGLAYAPFAHLFDWTEAQLAAVGARRVLADSHPGFPCRVSLRDAPIGAQLLLLAFEHQSADSPYRASGPIYVARDATAPSLAVNELPTYVTLRWISVRGYDGRGDIVDAGVAPGTEVVAEIQRLFANPRVAYLHLHNARYGCYFCRVDRV